MASTGRSRHRGVTWVSAATAPLVAAGLLAGAPPVTASTGAGIVVSALVMPQDAYPNQIVLRATADMVESDIAITREGSTIVVTESEGGPSLGLEAPTGPGVSCTSSSRSGPAEEIRCTFTGGTASSGFAAIANFASAPMGVTFGSDGTGDIRFSITGSAFDDYFEGGRRDDVITGGGGDDFLIGGSGNDRLLGGDGDDVIFGDGEEGDSTTGNDWIEGGAGDDYIDGGPGADSIWGGAGLDDIDAKDQVADVVVDCNDNASRGQETEDVVFDIKLDRPFDCGVNEAPQSVTAPRLAGPAGDASPGDTLSGVAATWRGTAPMTYSYAFETCRLKSDGSILRCTEQQSGALTAGGKDTKTGKDPQYRLTKADSGTIVRFVSSADNSKLRGGAKESVTSNVSAIVQPGITFKFPPWTLPNFQEGNGLNLPRTWIFASAGTTIKGEPRCEEMCEIVPWLKKSAIADNINISFEAVPRTQVPKKWRRDILNLDAFEIRVDGVALSQENRVVELSRSRKSEVVIRYWSSFFDKSDCGLSRKDVTDLGRSVKEVPTELMGFLDTLDKRGCTYDLDFFAVGRDSAGTPLSLVRSVEFEGSDPETGFARLQIRASEPVAGSLSLAVGAPRAASIAQSPDQPTIAVTGHLPSFGDQVPFGSVWVGLAGDQARQPTAPSRVDVMRISCPTFLGQNCTARRTLKGQMTGPFSTELTVPLGDTSQQLNAGVRILVTTFHDPSKRDKNGNLVPREQVFADIPVTAVGSRPMPFRMMLDGRCFTMQGTLERSCSAWANDQATKVIHQAVSARFPQLATLPAPDALRYASDVLGEGVRPLIVNGTFPGNYDLSYARSSVHTNSGSCAWWDLGCFVKALVVRTIDALIKPKPQKGRPAPQVVAYRLGSRVIFLKPGDAVLTVGGEKVLHVPGVGLIGLDGASLIGLDGASLIGLDGASLIGLDGASLIGLDGASLIGLDGASLIGLDGASAVGRVPLALAPPGLLSDQGGS